MVNYWLKRYYEYMEFRPILSHALIDISNYEKTTSEYHCSAINRNFGYTSKKLENVIICKIREQYNELTLVKVV